MTETGYKPTTPPDGHPSKGGEEQRLKIFLTNSLEEAHPDTQTLFSSWLSDEADQANAIKRDAPVMVVIGNPPYSGESSNKGEWIMNLMEDYKKEPGGKEKLKEQNSKFINDDYVKFMRFGQHFIDKNGEGILAFINPHGFLDNFTFRGMRWNLLNSFDKIYTIDLHGNSKKKEVCPDGSVDQNVFDIMQGVSINLFIKTGKKNKEELGEVFHFDLFGKRESKYDFLIKNGIKTIPYNKVNLEEPNYFFADKKLNDFEVEKSTFIINDLFQIKSLGLLTKRDKLAIDFDTENLKTKLNYFFDKSKSVDEVCKTFDLVIKDKDKWDANLVRSTTDTSNIDEKIRKVEYRPFDKRKVYYDSQIVARPNTKVLGNFSKDNYALISGKQGQAVGNMAWNLAFISNTITDQNIYYRGGGTVFPLYLYPEPNSQQNLLETSERVPNLNMEMVKKFADGLGLNFVAEKTSPPYGHRSKGEFQNGEIAPIDLLDYIYAVLHSPTYRETYKEFLKIDFPRVPYPTDVTKFWELVVLGGQLRQLHLLESETVENYITEYPEDGDNIVGKPKYVISKPLNSPPLEGCPKGGVVNTNIETPHFIIKNTTIYHNTITELPYNPKLKQRAKELRYAENLSEVLFWMQVHKNHFYKIDFDRQRIIGNYIVDFYVKKLGLVVEIDGSSHDGKEKYDAERERYLNSLGLKIFRIPVVDVLQNMLKALSDLERFIIEHYSVSLDHEKPPRPMGTPPMEGNCDTDSTENHQHQNLGRVYINETQYFDKVPETAWNFYIGGYQPAQKWLKDRKERELSFEDILHYQKMIVALFETDRIMKEIDKIEL
ncbi:type ISP restriction/modification enzyme [Flavobacterium sp. 7A]|uniref:type ISP restriction/modification enzyme n=1 Tax=Flavobacterium sp. 7A TaxID=2940571 RepID=UPI002225EADF|nr:type ISP restriction/modification enzyme [Flavobacterium sp. 7A]MCW2118196.1 putative helicase [Flavobacterium sp. 7A]